MKHLDIPFTASVNGQSTPGTVSVYLDKLLREPVDCLPWDSYPLKPGVKFSIAHSGDCLFIKFYVVEECVKAVYRDLNGPVYKDSCTEFFIAFDEDDAYYNLEFNCTGTCLAGFGSNRTDRKPVPVSLISLIKKESLIRSSNKKGFLEWELTLSIPLQVFQYHNLNSFTGEKCRINFFKCGDELDEPHYLCWNNILNQEVNFHQPEFFGSAFFLPSVQYHSGQDQLPLHQAIKATY